MRHLLLFLEHHEIKEQHQQENCDYGNLLAKYELLYSRRLGGGLFPVLVPSRKGEYGPHFLIKSANLLLYAPVP